MRVLVTGATSLIGRATVDLLHARGDSVVCLQRTPSDVPWPDGVEERRGDVADRAAVDAAIGDCDGVIHLAARVGVVGRRHDFESVNVGGTTTVLAAARSAGVARIVHVSSPSVAHDGHPVVGAGADPALAAHGRAWYPATKAIAERAALASSNDRMRVLAVRPHLVWGPGDTQLVGRIIDRARSGRLVLVGGGTALVDTTYVDDAASGLVAALDALGPGSPCAGRAYVIAGGEPRPIRDLVVGICRAAGVDAAPRAVSLRVARQVGSVVERVWSVGRRDDDPPIARFLADQLGTAHWFDPRPARDDLGWRPDVGIDEGLERLARWFADTDHA